MSYADTRFWPRVRKTDGCWVWTGTVHRQGYGWTGSKLAHRFAYEACVGPIAPGLKLDHRCHNTDPDCPGGRTCPHRLCVNPSHLEPVTHRVNVLRGKGISAVTFRTNHCQRGHELVGADVYTVPRTGARRCLVCVRARRRELRAQRKGGAAA